MGGIKVWDGTQWTTLNSLPGPQGPPGPQATDSSPRGPAGWGLSGEYPNPGPGSRFAAGTLLAIQRDYGVATATWRPVTSGATLMSISYSAMQDVWWEVDLWLGLVQADTAAYNYAYLNANLSPADADGISNRAVIYYQYNGVQTHAHRCIRDVFKLNAGDPATTYTLTATLTLGGGSWQWHDFDQSCSLTGKVWAQ